LQAAKEQFCWEKQAEILLQAAELALTKENKSLSVLFPDT
jgi:hypothetical protein